MGEEEIKKYLSDLSDRVCRLETSAPEKWVTVKELAKIMSCPENTIYIKIRSGVIKATRQTGEIRIPMSQFYGVGQRETERDEYQIRKPRRRQREMTMEEMIFGR